MWPSAARASQVAFADFSVRNLNPAAFYSEGAAWPAAPTTNACTVTTSAACARDFELDHMSSITAKVVPDAAVTNLTVEVTLPSAVTGARALLTIVRPRDSRAPRSSSLRRDAGSTAFQHHNREVRDVTLTNGNIQFQCNQRRIFSCQGRPLHDNSVMSVSATGNSLTGSWARHAPRPAA